MTAHEEEREVMQGVADEEETAKRVVLDHSGWIFGRVKDG